MSDWAEEKARIIFTAIAPKDDSEAPVALIAQALRVARAEGMREAAEICRGTPEFSESEDCAVAIEAKVAGEDSKP